MLPFIFKFAVVTSTQSMFAFVLCEPRKLFPRASLPPVVSGWVPTSPLPLPVLCATSSSPGRDRSPLSWRWSPGKSERRSWDVQTEQTVCPPDEVRAGPSGFGPSLGVASPAFTDCHCHTIKASVSLGSAVNTAGYGKTVTCWLWRRHVHSTLHNAKLIYLHPYPQERLEMTEINISAVI